ncbi:MAG: hypothetical protein KDB27_15620 [Planctomycetales bacterium]|nr:hypothetical protein [Planctomycetales bacterium]
MSHRRIALAVCALAVCGYSVYRLYAQDPAQVNPPAGPPTFASLVAADEAAEGRSKADSARVFADWMKANAWQNLPMEDQRVLVDKLDLDEVDFPNFSVRWTGTLGPTESGQYKFIQLQQNEHTSKMKVWVDGTLVLDSSNGQYETDEISLSSGNLVPIQVELVHDSSFEIGYSQGAPLAVLAWARNGGATELIPASAFKPPAGFANAASGLKADYFTGSTHEPSNKKASRLDPGVEFCWPWSPVVPVYESEVTAIQDRIWNQLKNGQAFTAHLNNKANLLNDALWQSSHRMPLSKRKEIIDMLLERPEFLREMTPYAMGKFTETVHMLPGGGHIELLKSWSLLRPQPRTEMGQYPGWGDGFYRTANSDFYWLAGFFLRGSNWPHVEEIWKDDLRKPNGECNLTLAYVTTFTAKEEGQATRFRKLLEAEANREELTGDQRMTWLLARAFAEEALVASEPQVTRGFEYLQEAMLVSESPDARFWALQEMVARLGSVDRSEQAKELLTQYEDEFSQTESKASIANWKQRMDALATTYVDIRNEVSVTPLLQHISELEARLARAQQGGKSDAVQRYSALLSQAKARVPDGR